MSEYNKAELDFFFTALKEEARTIIWDTGAPIEPQALVELVKQTLQELAPVENDPRTEEEIWVEVRKALLEAAYSVRPHCIRCGTCCTKGSPTLSVADLVMFRKDLLKPTDLITIRKGEPVYSNFTGEVAPAPVEMIKIKENPDSKTCSFFRRMDDSCAIYENRPEQCRDQECWNPAHVPAAGGERLQRAALLKDTAQLWDVIQHHENRCAQDEFSRAMARLSATHGQTVEEVLELLRYDHYIREFVMEQFGLNPDSMSFFFGRPLKETLFMYGLRLEEQPDGCFLLKPVEEGVHTGSATGD